MEIMAWLRLNSYNVLQEEDIHFADVQESAEFTPAHYTLPTRIWVSHYVVLDDLDLLEESRGDPQQLMTRHHFVCAHWPRMASLITTWPRLYALFLSGEGRAAR